MKLNIVFATSKSEVDWELGWCSMHCLRFLLPGTRFWHDSSSISLDYNNNARMPSITPSRERIAILHFTFKTGRARTLCTDLTLNLGTGTSRSQQQEPEAMGAHTSDSHYAVSKKATLH